MIYKECDLQEVELIKQGESYILKRVDRIDYLKLEIKQGFSLEELALITLKINDESYMINSQQITNIGNVLYLEIFNFDKDCYKFTFQSSLEILQCVALKRKQSLMLSVRYDAFGARMTSIISTIYCAQKTNAKFGFIWHPLIKEKQGISLASASELFESDFLQKHDYSKNITANYGIDKRIMFKSLKDVNQNPLKAWGNYYTDPFVAHKGKINDLDEIEYHQCFGKIFYSLPFRGIYKEQIKKADNLAKDIGQFIAIHMRAGDVIEDNHRRTALYRYEYLKYTFPVDFVIHTIKHFISKNFKVILFSSDTESSFAIKHFVKNEVSDGKFYIVKDLYENLNNEQEILFELTLMSCASQVISNFSTFAMFGAFLGEAKFTTNFNKLFTQKELFEAGIIPRFKDVLLLSNTQKTLSCVYLYVLAKKLNLASSIKLNLLNLAIEFDTSNPAHKIILIDVLFTMNSFTRVEKLLEKYICESEESYVSCLLSKWDNVNLTYANECNQYLKNASIKYPYTCYVASKIYESQKDFINAIKFAKIASKGEPYNEMFKEYLFNVLLQKEKEQPKQVSTEKAIKETPIPNIYLASAKDRIHNHLAYKLGQAMILNSKSLLGYIRMPYVLSYIKEAHRKEIAEYEAKVVKNPKLKLPKLESYPDYKEALKEKECFTYKLGEALIKANSVRGGGRIFAYLAFFQEVRRLKREFREKRK